MTDMVKKSNRFKSVFSRWETMLFLIFIIFNIIMSFTTPYYLNARNILDMTFIFMEKGLIALIMTLIIITGNIDLSVASTMSLSSVVMAVSFQSGINIWISVLLGILAGTFCGFLNGFIITRLSLPSMIITLATFSFYRGISYVILGDKAVSGFTEKFTYLGQGYIGNTKIPFPLIVFIVLAIIFSLVLHKTFMGRMIYAIGWNENSCFASGIPVKKIKLILFTLSGFISSFAAMFLTARIGNTRPNLATGFELEIITIVILGGVMMSGGTGTMPGVIISIFLIGTIRYGLGLHNVPGQIMLIISGTLLILSILINNFVKNFTKPKPLRQYKLILAAIQIINK